MRTAFGSVIYREAFSYAGDFVASLNSQTCRDFDVLLVNDNLEGEAAEELASALTPRTVVVESGAHRIFETRIRLLKEAKKRGYELLVVGDFDDRFSENRVEAVRRAAEDDKETHVFYYNELTDFEGRRAFREVPRETADFRDILEYNYLGLGNAAFRIQELDDGFLQSLYQGETPVFDWYLFSRLLLLGCRGKFVEQASTLYRLHENNLAGLPRESGEAVGRELRVKLAHYRLLAPYHCEYERKLEQYRELEKKLNNDYILGISRRRRGYWWELLATEEE